MWRSIDTGSKRQAKDERPTAPPHARSSVWTGGVLCTPGIFYAQKGFFLSYSEYTKYDTLSIIISTLIFLPYSMQH